MIHLKLLAFVVSFLAVMVHVQAATTERRLEFKLKSRSASVGQSSALTLKLCPGTSSLEHTITFEIVGEKTTSINVGNRQGQSESPYTVKIGQLYPQKSIKHVTVKTQRQEQILCVQALVVDVTILIDRPTEIKHTCPEPPDLEALPCTKFGDVISPSFICPQKLTKLLQEKQQIKAAPTEIPTDFKPPVYDITNDMAQASLSIADGLTEGYGKVVKTSMTAYKESIKAKPLGKVASTIQSFSSFLGALGPVFSIFSGITSILTNFLTPNPFDELAKYMDKQFEQVNERLTDIQSDIADLSHILEAHGSVLAMSDQIRAVRYAVRNYGNLVKKLAGQPMCGSGSLLELVEVTDFMRQYEADNVEHSLLDLYLVEFGGVTEAGNRLLNPFMKAYCHSNIGRVEKFAQELSFYGYAGSLAHFAYKNLQCIKQGSTEDCNEPEKEKEEWMKKLYNFLKKTQVFKDAAKHLGYGLWMDVKDDLEGVIRDETKKVSPTATTIPGLFDKVYDYIIAKLTNPNDWSNECIVKVDGTDDHTTIIEVAQIEETISQDFYHAYDSGPWHKKIAQVKFYVKKAVKDSNRKSYKSAGINCDKTGTSCGTPSIYLPDTGPTDRVVYIMFNPKMYQAHYEHPKVIPMPFQTVFINFKALYAYYDKDGSSGIAGDVYVNCWAHCGKSQEQDLAIIKGS